MPIETTQSPGELAALLELIRLGGPVVAILLALSVLALAIVLLKLWQFGAMGVWSSGGPVREAVQLYRAGRAGEALALLDGRRGPAARIVAGLIRGMRRPGADAGALRDEAMRQGQDALHALQGQLRMLDAVGAVSTLLGLFGTVLGMIDAFRGLERAGSQVDPSILSGGIWVALLTTAVGLAIAIPVVMLHNWLDGQVEKVAHRIEDSIGGILTAAATGGDDAGPAREPAAARPAGMPA